MIGGPGSRPPEPIKWSVEPLLPEPSAVDFLAALEDPTGESALRVAAWKTQVAGFETLAAGGVVCEGTLTRLAGATDPPKMLMGYQGKSVFDTGMIFSSEPPPKPDAPSAVDELAALTDESARARVEETKRERERWDRMMEPAPNSSPAL